MFTWMTIYSIQGSLLGSLQNILKSLKLLKVSAVPCSVLVFNLCASTGRLIPSTQLPGRTRYLGPWFSSHSLTHCNGSNVTSLGCQELDALQILAHIVVYQATEYVQI